MAKPLEQMTLAELRDRLLELRVSEEKHLMDLHSLRWEMAQVTQMLAQKEAKK